MVAKRRFVDCRGGRTFLWLSWLLMPGVGVTDSAQIFALVERKRPSVMISVVAQLISAALTAPSLQQSLTIDCVSGVHCSIIGGVAS